MAKLDPVVAKRIQIWLDKNLYMTTAPRAFGKPLSGNLKGKWRYRIGMYRIIALINDGDLLILCLTVENRKDIYR